MKKIIIVSLLLLLFTGCETAKARDGITISDASPVTEEDNIIATNYNELIK